MYSRSLFIRLDKLNIHTINDAVMIREYLELFICYIAKKIIINEGYPYMDIRYNYISANIDNAFTMTEHFAVMPNLDNFLLSLNSILTKNIRNVIHEFYMSDYAANGSLNLNSMLVNCDSLLITYEFFQK